MRLFMVCKRCNDCLKTLALVIIKPRRYRSILLLFLLLYGVQKQCQKEKKPWLTLHYVTTGFPVLMRMQEEKVSSGVYFLFRGVPGSPSCGVPELHARICIYLYEIISRINQMYQNKNKKTTTY